MRQYWTLSVALAAAPLAAQDHPAKPEPADHAASMSAHDDMHRHDVDAVPKEPTLLEGYGVGGFAVTTRIPQAQAFFSNGMELGAAFAHSAAIAAMAHAVALDPACAMCTWGQALVSGPTINYGKDAREREPLAVLANEAARQAAAGGTPKEKALTAALVERYRPGRTAERDVAYAHAMEAVQRQFPQDKEIAVLTADALMVSGFANYPNVDMATFGRAIPLLQGVLARDPNHTPAIHFYIHATEALRIGARAEPYADRLEGLAPRASHLVHMPAHTWFWLGRYEDAARANMRAVEIGKENAARLGLPGPDGVWGLPYHAHNVIYGLGGALMAGDAEVALALARPLVAVSAVRTDDGPVAQLLASLGYDAIARFDPKSVAALPEPKLPYLKAAWHYARGEAAASVGDSAALRGELAAIPATIHKTGRHDAAAPEQMLGIVRAVLAGRLAMLQGNPAAAAGYFRAAAEIEETPSFNDFTDPPAFWYPVRRDLAAALLAAGDAAGARREAQASLKLRVKDPVAEALLARTASASR